MTMSFSPHVAIEVRDYEKAVLFYQHAFGMQVVGEQEGESELQLGAMTFHVSDAPAGHVYFEFRTDDMERERERLVQHGCKVTRLYSEKSVMMEDPYGMRFHLFEE